MLKKPRRPSAPSSSRPSHFHPGGATSTTGPMEDVSHLSLVEVRARLERNERLCHMLARPDRPAVSMPSSPISPVDAGAMGGFASFGPVAPAGSAGVAGVGQVGSPGPGSVVGAPPDPVMEKLLLARQALHSRENELLLLQAQEGLQQVRVGEIEALPVTASAPASYAGVNGLPSVIDRNGAESSADARRRASDGTAARARVDIASPASGVLRSGKMRALERIEAGEHRLAPGGLILPVRDSLALSSRDYDNATAQSLAAMSLARAPQGSPSPRDRRAASPTPRSRKKQPVDATSASGADRGGFDETDEIARAQAQARMRAFLGYKGDGDDEDDDFEEEDDGYARGGRGAAVNGDTQLEDWGEDEGDYDGDEDRVELHNTQGAGWRERGTGEEVDEYGEDGEEWAEGNDHYFDRVREGDEAQVNQADGV